MPMMMCFQDSVSVVRIGAFFGLAVLHELLEDRGFVEPAADVQRDQEHRDGGQERDAPAEGVEVSCERNSVIRKKPPEERMVPIGEPICGSAA